MARLLDRVKAFLDPPPTAPTPKPAVPADKLDDMQLALRNVVKASYDTLQRTPENMRHWQWADHLAADASLNPAVRIGLRAQSRYELNENNSYGDGIVSTVVTDTIGTGPRLQVSEFRHSMNQRVEQEFMRWAEAVDLPSKLETIRRSKLVDGESVFRFINNMGIEDPVQLDLQLIECDQLRSPQFELTISENYVDGVHLDRFGNPYAYDILQHHPGASYYNAVDLYAYDTYGVDQITHLFNRRRPGQHRGVPEFSPALPLFAFLRRFTLATVSAAETAASVSQVLETDAPIPEELDDKYTDWMVSSFEKWAETIPVDRNSATVLPNMWKLKQFAAEHPTTTYKMFKREIVAEIGRCLCVPVTTATLDSGESNFSSTKFDWLGYERRIERDQHQLGSRVLDRIFAEWLLEASLIGVLPVSVANYVISQYDRWGRRGLASRVAHAWYWDGLRDSNEKDAADAQKTRLSNGTTHRATEYAKQGKDVEVEDEKAARSFGITVEEYRQLVMSSVFTNGNLMVQDPEGEQTDNSGTSQQTENQDQEQEANA